MARWAGKLGFVLPAVETQTGVYEEPVTEVDYKGEILRESRGAAPGVTHKNLDPYLRMAVSVIPDTNLKDNIMSCRYATVYNVKWSVTSFEVQGIRYILNLGDKYG